VTASSHQKPSATADYALIPRLGAGSGITPLHAVGLVFDCSFALRGVFRRHWRVAHITAPSRFPKTQW
jgi:hypothetical protein